MHIMPREHNVKSQNLKKKLEIPLKLKEKSRLLVNILRLGENGTLNDGTSCVDFL